MFSSFLLHSGDPKRCKLVFMGEIREYYIYIVRCG